MFVSGAILALSLKTCKKRVFHVAFAFVLVFVIIQIELYKISFVGGFACEQVKK